jgi:hypothetical protein
MGWKDAPGQLQPAIKHLEDQCEESEWKVSSPYLSTWWSDNNSIATAQPAQGNGISAGSTNLWGDGFLPGSSNGISDDPNGCP